MMSDGEDDDHSSIFIWRGYYGDSLDGPDGSQPVDEPFEPDEEHHFNVSNPSRNFVSSDSETQIKNDHLLDNVGNEFIHRRRQRALFVKGPWTSTSTIPTRREMKGGGEGKTRAWETA